MTKTMKAKDSDSFLSIRLKADLKKRIQKAANRRFQRTSDFARELLTQGVDRVEKASVR